MSELGERIIQRGYVEAEDGTRVDLHSHTRLDQCQYLQRLIREVKPETCLEIGLAFGLSALFICEELKAHGGCTNIVIDKYQNDSVWQGIGLKNIAEAGHSGMVDFREDYAEAVLPRLVDQGEKVDFAYIDAGKRFDVGVVFVHYVTKLLSVGGLLVLDDCTFPGLRKLARYLHEYPCYEKHSHFGRQEVSAKRKAVAAACRLVPYGHKIFAPDIALPDHEIGLNAHCLTFRKVKDDDLHWAWHGAF